MASCNNPNIISCTSCNKEISKDASSCPNCGAKTIYKKKSEYSIIGSSCLGFGVFGLIVAWVHKVELAGNRYTLPSSTDEMGLTLTTLGSIALIIMGIVFLIKSKTESPSEDSRNKKNDCEQRLATILRLKDDGLITEEEFQLKKQEFLKED